MILAPQLSAGATLMAVFGAGRPEGVGAVMFEKVALGFEMAHFGQGQGERKKAPVHAGHGDIIPAFTQRIFTVINLANDFPPQPVDLPQGGFSAMPARPMIQAPSG
jgi:hypothetical protein